MVKWRFVLKGFCSFPNLKRKLKGEDVDHLRTTTQ